MSESIRHPACTPRAPIVEVDVRDDLREGREPLARIMAAASALGEGEVLHVRAIFHPVPLLAVLGRKGFVSESEQHAPNDWSVWFWRDSVPEAALPSHTRESSIVSPRTRENSIVSPRTRENSIVSPRSRENPLVSPRSSENPLVSPRTREASVGASAIGESNTAWLDVRGLHPPEPLVHTLAALDALLSGQQLIQINERVPQFLLPMLAERGFAWELDDSHADRVLLRIWRPNMPECPDPTTGRTDPNVRSAGE